MYPCLRYKTSPVSNITSAPPVKVPIGITRQKWWSMGSLCPLLQALTLITMAINGDATGREFPGRFDAYMSSVSYSLGRKVFNFKDMLEPFLDNFPSSPLN
jgi:hypothetical protein